MWSQVQIRWYEERLFKPLLKPYLNLKKKNLVHKHWSTPWQYQNNCLSPLMKKDCRVLWVEKGFKDILSPLLYVIIVSDYWRSVQAVLSHQIHPKRRVQAEFQEDLNKLQGKGKIVKESAGSSSSSQHKWDTAVEVKYII